mgnify:CR=1 FL=1
MGDNGMCPWMRCECVGTNACAPALLLAGEAAEDRECPIVSITECAQIISGFLVTLSDVLPGLTGQKTEQHNPGQMTLPGGIVIPIDQG